MEHLLMTEKTETKPAIVFDLGGVLMDWSPYYLYCDKLGIDRKTVDRFLEEVDFAGWNQEQDRGRTFKEATRELSARFPHYREMIYAYDSGYLDSLGEPFQPVVDILGRLKNAGLSVYALSNWPAEKFALVRPIYPFFEWFDGLIISGEVGLIKPDHRIFQLLLEKVNRPVQECLFIDDHLSNIRVASELGFQTIHFQSAEQLEDELEKRGIFTQKSG
jgi:2-haloacid dehalogenase